MLLRILLVLVSLPLLAVGAEGLFHVLRNRQQTTASCDEFARRRPNAAWVRLTNCEVDYMGAGVSEGKDGRITELFFPVRPMGQPRETPAFLVVATHDRTALATAQTTIGAGRQPNQEQFLVMMLTIVTQLKASREIQGYARRGLVDVWRAQQLLGRLSAPLDPRFVTIDLHAEPSWLLPGAEAAAGALGLTAFVLLTARRTKTHRAPGPEAAPAPAPALAPAPAPAPLPLGASARVRGIMLLNLPPGAGAEDVEMAPPLGGRDEVLDRLGAVMPGISSDARGRCLYSRPDHAITIDLGPGEPVATAVVDAEGDGAIAAVRALLETTGWRAYAPKLGRFVEAGDIR